MRNRRASRRLSEGNPSVSETVIQFLLDTFVPVLAHTVVWFLTLLSDVFGFVVYPEALLERSAFIEFSKKRCV